MCIYGTELSFDGTFNVTTIKTPNPYIDYKHCWALFTCQSGFQVQYYFDYFNTKNRNDPLWLTGEGFAKEFMSNSGDSFPTLYEWQSTDVQVLDIQFRTDESSVREGYKLRLRCSRIL